MKKRHLLLVCKDERLENLMHDMCKKWGCELNSAKHSGDAMEYIEKNKFDIIIIASDIVSYSLEEWNLAKDLRRMGCRVPIIAITDHSVPGDALKAYQCGIDEHLVKPFDIDRLHLYIESHLKNTGKANYRKTLYPQFESRRDLRT